MRNLIPLVLLSCVLCACSPRDVLSRRLAADLIAGSETFQAYQQFWLRTGVISSKDYNSPEYLVLQRRGWITGSPSPCPADVAPPPCWDVVLSPLGVETFRTLIPNADAAKQYFSVPTAHRELLAITGISRNGNLADVDFVWRWVALNEVGAALYTSNVHYRSTVTFRDYDDGWRLIEGSAPKDNQGLDEALKNAVPAP